MRVLVIPAVFILVGGLGVRPASASTVADVGTPALDPPTPATIGVRLPIPADLASQASAAVRYRAAGAADWHPAPTLHRVHAATWPSPNTSIWPNPIDVPEQFAGSIFGLRPATGYDIEITVTDGTGGTTIRQVSASTSALPGYPAAPHVMPVDTSGGLQTALDAAGPGTVVQLAAGTYTGNFHLDSTHDGTAENPVVIQPAWAGSGPAQVTLRGGAGSTGGVALALSADHVQISNLTITHASHGILITEHVGADGSRRATTGVSVQRTTMTDVHFGIASDGPFGIHDAYLCDNDLTGELARGGYNNGSIDFDHGADWDGIMVGSGSTVCHNTIRGFWDAMIVYNASAADEPRGIDFVGNDIQWTYDNGVEADHSFTNVRIYRNRFLNSYAPLSFQPVFGGPAYAFRNVLVNVKNDVFKLHGDGNNVDGPAGVLIDNNTVVSDTVPLALNTTSRSTDFELRNNLFVGSGGQSANWFGLLDPARAIFDYNGYEPDGYYWFGSYQGKFLKYYKLDPVNTHDGDGAVTSVHTGHLFEEHGQAVGSDVFTNLGPWPTWDTPAEASVSAALSPTTRALNTGANLPGINEVPDGHPDLGALEFSCAAPAYGVRRTRTDDSEGPEPNQSGAGADDPCNTPPVTVAAGWPHPVNATATGSTLTASAVPGGATEGMQVKDSALSTWANGLDFTWPSSTTQGCVGFGAAFYGLPACTDLSYQLQLNGQQVTAMAGGSTLATVNVPPGARLSMAIVNGQVWFGVDGNRFAVTPFTRRLTVPSVVLLSPGATLADAHLARITSMSGV